MPSFLIRAVALATIITAGLSQSIDPNSVPKATRDYWCQSQITQCPLICTQENNGSPATLANDCDSTNLGYDCVCANGLAPNASQYSQTMPYFICTQYNTQCVANCGLSNNACASACRDNHPCGAQNPTRVNASTITTSSTATSNAAAKSTGSDGSVVYSGFGAAAASTTAASSQKSGSAAIRLVGLGEIYGLGVVAAGIFAGFALIL